MIRAPERTAAGGRARAFTLVEAVMSILILSVMLVAALRTLGAAGAARTKGADRVRGRALADSLMAEILTRSYADTGGAPTFGRDGAESAALRSTLNDLDDYHALVETPPVDSGGSPIAGATGLKRSVAVEWVLPANVSSVSAVETGAKRITVTVSRNGVVLARRVAVRTNVD